MQKKLEISFIDRIYLFYVLLFAARATVFTSNMDYRINPFGFLLLVVPCLYLVREHRITFIDKRLVRIYVLLFLWMFIHYFVDETFKLLPYVILFINVSIGYVLIKVFREDIYELVECYITILTAVCLVLWVAMHVVGIRIFESLGFMEPTSNTSVASLLVFNVPNMAFYENQGIAGLMRNCGFAWEPGLFASIICIAIYFNLISKKTLIGNWRFYILVLGLLSTFSTTGYSALMLILVNHFIFQNKGKILRYIYLFLFLPLFLAIMSLSFMAEKMKTAGDSSWADNKAGMISLEMSDTYMTVQRGEGLYLDYLNFIDKPVLGYGTECNSYVANRLSDHLLTSNGVMKDFARFGIILALFINIVFIQNAKYIDKLYNQRYCMFYFLMVVISISYPFSTLPLIIALCFNYMWSNTKTDTDNKKITIWK